MERPETTTRVQTVQAEEKRLSWFVRAKFEVARAFLDAWMGCFGLTGLYRFGRFFGTCEWLINYKLRRRFRNRLKSIYGPNELDAAKVRRLTRQWFVRMRCDKLFYLVFDHIPKERLLDRIEFVGRQYIDDGLARGRGVYAAMPHAGTHHVVGALMAIMGYKVAGVRDRKEGALRLHMQEVFGRRYPEVAAIRVFFADEYPRDLFRCFQENYILGTALDVDRERAPHLKRQKVRVFGQEREWLTGTLQIALRCRATIIPGFWVSLPDYHFQLIAHAPLDHPDTARDEPGVVAEAMQRYADLIEAHVRANPDHLSKV